jgi:hypothetical protein
MGPRYDGGKSPLSAPVSQRFFEGYTLAQACLHGRSSDTIVTPAGGVSTVHEMREALAICGYTPEQFAAASSDAMDKVLRRLERLLLKRQKDAGIPPMTSERAREIWGDGIQERDDLHQSLRIWADGPLKLEKPQGSSLHHLCRYDLEHGGRYGTILHEMDLQPFVVENDWGRAVPLVKGEWRLPFQHICWEFRISGVRVLAFTDATDVEYPVMILAYGRDRVWVGDDHKYTLHQDRLSDSPLVVNQRTPFRKVAAAVFANIRASCIMLDAQVAHDDEVRAPEALVRRAQRDRVAPPRNYRVVRLLRRAPRAGHRGGTSVGGHKQGGHWRPGRWLHYSDQDSGQVQYVNDGGFFVSKSWQRWHFAGDPNRIIEREYRL